MGNVTLPFKMDDSSWYVAGFNFRCDHHSQNHIYFQGKLSGYRHYGTYHDHMCIVKAMKANPPKDSALWDEDKARLECAHEMADRFKNLQPDSPIHICFNKMYQVEMDETSECVSSVFGSGRTIEENEYVLVSPYMTHVEPLALNSANEILSAFSHFTWDQTNGEKVLTDFKGHKHPGDERYDLLLPTIHSRGNSYGDKDKGEEGIKQFFKTHRCNERCQSANPVH